MTPKVGIRRTRDTYRWELVCIKQGKPRSWQAGDGDWTTETEEEEVEEAAAAAAAARDEQAAIAMAIAAGAAERWERENNGQVTTAG